LLLIQKSKIEPPIRAGETVAGQQGSKNALHQFVILPIECPIIGVGGTLNVPNMNVVRGPTAAPEEANT